MVKWTMHKKIHMIISLIIVFSLTIGYFTTEGISSSELTEKYNNRYDQGFRYNIQGWVYLHIEGAPYERGYQYGYLASDEIIDLINRWSIYGCEVKIMNLFKVKSPERWWELCKSIAIKNSLEEYPREYQEEIEGIADGMRDKGGKIHGHDVEFEDILTLNEMQGCWYSLKYLFKMFHPLKNIYNGMKKIFSQESGNEEEGACSVFIATGDATADGEIIAVHSTQPLYYLDERFNFIIDIQPSEGNRFIMAGTPPGFIWGLVNFYQNEKGIILMESTLPQGPWKKKGVPIAVRSRNAIQYSDCIDDVLDNLLEGNNGLYECEWLIGDTKTGEIASIELALYNTPVKRTHNGFYWSCNYPHDPAVRREVTGGVPPIISNLVTNVFENSKNVRAGKFQEIEKEYYGQIDIENTKQIISADPLCVNSCDAKITSTKLIENMGLILHMGNPNGEEWAPTSEEKEKFKGVTNLPASGWVEIYPANYKNFHEKEKLTTSRVTSNNVEYFGSWDGNIYALNSDTGTIKWKYKTGWGIVKPPTIEDGLVFVGSLDNSFYALNEEDGRLEWVYPCKSAIHSSPVVYGEYVFFGCDDGQFYALDKNTGEKAWSFAPGYYLKDDVYNYLTTPIISDPYIKGGTVYFNVKDETHALDTQTTESKVDIRQDTKDLKGYYVLIILSMCLVAFFLLIVYMKKYKK